ncbi:phosphoglycerate mutase [Nitratireductor aquibiodomus RA22]|uniref:Phosphoglycerate mutase n=1 Tax=Nitratireductor aquibiodomus RA22 TaxID=1189611 RepID=I5BR90_9HYPH|nr:histidine phosphatase family protein [Nitratireductor aquibiodomus]EIM72092.1 phosphoglycerate mutase [Nitratireductor aquibiodomus RA22]
MAKLIFITHPEVIVDPAIAVEDWGLSDAGRERMIRFAASDAVADIRTIWTSAERKAREAAVILNAERRTGVRTNPMLGENDRSATGFLPPAEFERTADAFFASPAKSIRGWERAVDAQARIYAAVSRIVAGHDDGDLAIVSHGAAGTLLLCKLRGIPIDRAHDQPFQGHFWAAALPDMEILHHWMPIAPKV